MKFGLAKEQYRICFIWGESGPFPLEALKMKPRPPGVEKLSAQEKYRIRLGIYRILYEIENNKLIIVVVKIGHRRHVYRMGK